MVQITHRMTIWARKVNGWKGIALNLPFIKAAVYFNLPSEPIFPFDYQIYFNQLTIRTNDIASCLATRHDMPGAGTNGDSISRLIQDSRLVFLQR